MRGRLYRVLFLVVVLCLPLFAQSENDQLAAFLQKRGFDHLEIRSNETVAGISFENLGYRSEILAAKMVAAGSAIYLGNRHIYLMPQYGGIPMTLLQKDNSQMGDLNIKGASVEIPQFHVASAAIQKKWRKYAVQPPFHSRMEIIFHPEFKALFGNYNDPLRTQINLVPEIRVALLRGVQFSSHVIIPVYDDITSSPVRPGPTWLTHLLRIKQSFVFYSAGLLFNDRYGIQFGTHSFIRSSFALSARIGYSGAAMWQDNKMNLYPLERLTYNFKIVYFNSPFQFFTSLGYHRFLDGLNGWRFDFYRYFHELRIGFWGMAVQGEMNGGFHLAIALPPFKYKSSKRVRLRPANYFRWEYRAAALNGIGQSLKANIYLDDQFDRYTPAFLNARL